jgi:hypothetical protein
MAMMIAITQGSVIATLDWERVADAARDELDKTVLQVIDEPVARTDVEHLNDEEMDALRADCGQDCPRRIKGTSVRPDNRKNTPDGSA